MTGFRLGIDLGTSNTAAVLRSPDGRARPVLFDGSPLLPSAVYAEPGGTLLTGREARHSGRVTPERYEPNPKRRIDDGVVLLGDDELTVTALLAAVLRQVRAEAERTVGGPVADVVLTCPAAWGPRRRAILTDAAAAAGLGSPELVAEPIAAARYFVEVLSKTLPPDGCLVVYDFGAGTFDVSVVRRGGDGFRVLADQGLADVGGLDIDAAAVGYLGATYAGRYPDQWQRLEQPGTTADRRARRLLWDDVRSAKEILSRTSNALIPIPLLDQDAPLGREQLERLARPLLDRTVAATKTAIRTAGITPADVHGIFLVGGSSRIPLVSTLLLRECGVAPTAIEQPELVVAEGAAVLPTAAAPPATVPAAPSVEATWPAPVTASALVIPPPAAPAAPSTPTAPPSPVAVAEKPAAPVRAGRTTQVLAGIGTLIAAVLLVAWPFLPSYSEANTRDPSLTINGVPAGGSPTLDLDQPIKLAGQVPDDVDDSEWDNYEVAVSFQYLGYGIAEVHVPKTVTGDRWSAEVTPPTWLDDLAGGAMGVDIDFYHEGAYIGGSGWSLTPHFAGFPLWSVAGVGATLTLAGAATLLAVLGVRIRRGVAGMSGSLIAAAMALLTSLWAFVMYVITREGAGEEVAPVLAVAVGTYLLLGFVGRRGPRRLAAFVGVPGGVAVWLLTICLARLDSHLADIGLPALLGALTAVGVLKAVTQDRQVTPTTTRTSRPARAAV